MTNNTENTASSDCPSAPCSASFWVKGRVWTEGSGDYRGGYLWTAEIDIARHRGAIQCHAKTEEEAKALRDSIFEQNDGTISTKTTNPQSPADATTEESNR